MADFNITGEKVIGNLAVGSYLPQGRGRNWQTLPTIVKLPNVTTSLEKNDIYNEYVENGWYYIIGSGAPFQKNNGKKIFERDGIEYFVSITPSSMEELISPVKDKIVLTAFAFNNNVFGGQLQITVPLADANTTGATCSFCALAYSTYSMPYQVQWEFFAKDDNNVTYYDNAYFINGFTAARPVANYSLIKRIYADDLDSTPSLSVAGGGIGSFNDNSDSIDLPSIPSISVVGSGFFTIYNPSIPQMKGIADWLWSTDLLDKLFINPLQLIAGAYITPILPNNIQNNVVVKIGGKDTGVNSAKVLNEYQYFHLGEISLSEYYGNFIDYQCQLSIYLPYHGTENIDINEFMAGTISVSYLVNFLDGTTSIFIKAKRGKLNSVVYQFSTNIFNQLTLTSQDNRILQSALLQSALNVATSASNPTSLASSIASSATNIMTQNKQYQHSNTTQANAGFLGVQKAYLIISRPIQSLSAGFVKDNGYTSNIYSKLSSLTGFTKVSLIDLSNINCTEHERQRLDDLLKNGVYL